MRFPARYPWVATCCTGCLTAHRGHWQLFVDWCTAVDAAPLPAATPTVARFLDFEPELSKATLRRRVSAINTAHRTAGYAPPGTVTAIRTLLSARDRHAATVFEVIGRLPVSGWPTGLFGRRDALLLTPSLQGWSSRRHSRRTAVRRHHHRPCGRDPADWRGA